MKNKRSAKNKHTTKVTKPTQPKPKATAATTTTTTSTTTNITGTAGTNGSVTGSAAAAADPTSANSNSNSTSTSPPISRASTPSAGASSNSSKTPFVRPPLALTKLQDNQETVEPYSPHDPYFTTTNTTTTLPHAKMSAHIHGHTHHHTHHHTHPHPHPHSYSHPHPHPHPNAHVHIQDPGIEPADPDYIQQWEENLRRRLEQAYPRMAYYFLCDKSLFILVTLLTLQRMTKADILSGKPVGKGRQDRQFVDNIAQCMSDAENRPDKDEEWMTWWRETLLAVQGGLQKGWIDADSPVRNIFNS